MPDSVNISVSRHNCSCLTLNTARSSLSLCGTNCFFSHKWICDSLPLNVPNRTKWSSSAPNFRAVKNLTMALALWIYCGLLIAAFFISLSFWAPELFLSHRRNWRYLKGWRNKKGKNTTLETRKSQKNTKIHQLTYVSSSTCNATADSLVVFICAMLLLLCFTCSHFARLVPLGSGCSGVSFSSILKRFTSSTACWMKLIPNEVRQDSVNFIWC